MILRFRIRKKRSFTEIHRHIGTMSGSRRGSRYLASFKRDKNKTEKVFMAISKYRNNEYATIGSVEYSEMPQKPTFSALQTGPSTVRAAAGVKAKTKTNQAKTQRL